MKPKPAVVRLLWIVIVFLSLIGVAIVIRRIVALTAPASPSPNFPGGPRYGRALREASA